MNNKLHNWLLSQSLSNRSFLNRTNSWFAKVILPKRYSTIMMFPFVFSKNTELSLSTLRHENVHRQQYIECSFIGILLATFLHVLNSALHVVAMSTSMLLYLALPVAMFYILYGSEYVIRMIVNAVLRQHLSNYAIYRSVSLEQDAYTNQYWPGNVYKREPYEWFKYLFNNASIIN